MSKEFPFEEKFLDYEGNERIFKFTIQDVCVGKCIMAKDLGSFYKFSICTTDNDFSWAIGDLRSKINKKLSTRYLQKINNEYTFSHDEIEGDIDSKGIVIDGNFISFNDFSSMLEVYEGSSFKLEIKDSNDK